MLDKTKKLPIFFHWKNCLFFKRLFSQHSLRCYRNDPLTSVGKCQNILWSLINCSLRCVTLDITRENVPKTYVNVKRAISLRNVIDCSLRFALLCWTRKKSPKVFFSTEKIELFELFSYQPLKVVRKLSYNLHNKCQNTLWTLISCSLRFFLFDNTRNDWPKNFSLRRIAFISKKNCS